MFKLLLRPFTPKCHSQICGNCGRPVHPWEDECYYCGCEINWPPAARMEKPDWFSRVFEQDTSYKRWQHRFNAAPPACYKCPHCGEEHPRGKGCPLRGDG